jgi:cytochrome P450 PksS
MLRTIPPIWLFLRLIRSLIRDRRAQPRDDLLGALVLAEEAGQKLSEDELLAMVFLLLVAGHETTVNLIGNGLLALIEYPAEMDRLRREPTLIRPAIEELLRYGSPVETGTERYALEDIQLAGTTIPRGSLVFAAIASANRDERQFPDPDKLDLGREPNKHLAFGLGPHYCLGAALARLEGQIAVNALLRRTRALRMKTAAERLTWRPGLVLRGLESLPLAVTWV